MCIRDRYQRRVHGKECTPNTNLLCQIPEKLETKAVCKESRDSGFRYPGEYCSSDSECLGIGQCKDKICLGKNEKEGCISDLDCAAGLYCLNSTCNETIKEGEACDKDHKCKANAFCHKQKCRIPMQLENGKSADVPALCKSYFSINNGICSEGPKLVMKKINNKEIKNCTDDICTYKYIDGKEEKNFTTLCSCGMNQFGQAYCNKGAREVDVDSLSEYLKSEAAKCHISKGPFCLTHEISEMSVPFHKAYVANEELMNDARYQDNEECVKNMINNLYWKSKDVAERKEIDKESLYIFLGATFGFLVIVGVVILIFYLRNKKNEDTEEEEESGESPTYND
eukprot:TRINITY_DN3360_c0_g1_i3.p2 TRINITY_DN3360_c0_g1~~TRINITY_DN3360_c0_g1_i3.p2  ORF type:complete len:340 (+),score=60.76 TRINITY_DN3360_c0_g1_i3:139-1158(+)